MPHYFIDGYNVMRSVDWFSTGAVENQRETFLRFIESNRPQGRSGVTVVFDGHGRGSERGTGVRVVFSLGKEADTVIRDRVDQLVHPADAVVVTNDRAIQRWVRGAGARVMGCRDFLTRGKKPPPSHRVGQEDGGESDVVTEELWRLWGG